MQVIERKIEDIRPYENNPRDNSKAIDAVAASIKEFGFKVPIVIDKDGVIVTGHTRYEASKKLGLKKVPCIIADDLTGEQVKAFRLADNKTAELADWDYNILELELDDIEELDMSDFGFNNTDISDEDNQQEMKDIDLTEKRGGSKECECPACGFKFEI